MKGSGYITSQCCGSTEIEIGTVYAAELGITLLSEVDRYALEDGKIELLYHLVLADGAEKTVPMGIFKISEANRTIRCLEIKAYDYMLRFEKIFNGFETVGNAYAFLLSAGITVKGFAETIGIETMELVQRQRADSMGRVSIGAFNGGGYQLSHSNKLVKTII